MWLIIFELFACCISPWLEHPAHNLLVYWSPFNGRSLRVCSLAFLVISVIEIEYHAVVSNWNKSSHLSQSTVGLPFHRARIHAIPRDMIWILNRSSKAKFRFAFDATCWRWTHNWIERSVKDEWFDCSFCISAKQQMISDNCSQVSFNRYLIKNILTTMFTNFKKFTHTV